MAEGNPRQRNERRVKLSRRFLLSLCPWAIVLVGGALLLSGCTATPGADIPIPSLRVGVEQAESPQDVALGLEIIALLTVLTLAPAILIMMTAFTRIVIVLAILRSAIGIPQVPPNQVLTGLALFLTFFVMAPTFEQMNEQALQPYMRNEIDAELALTRAVEPLREFMFRQTREADLALFVRMARVEQPRTREEVPTYVLIPAFVISELKTAFQMGLFLFVPFLVIDIVVATTLLSMCLLMLPPVIISLPFKILLFVLVDGWHLVAQSLVEGFR